MAVPIKQFHRFAHKVLRSKKYDFKTLLKSFPDFKISQGTHLYHMVEGALQSYVKQEYKKTAAASTRIPPTEKKKITLAQLTYFYFCFRFFPYTINPNDPTDIQRTGIAIVRDNSPRTPTYGNGSYNDYVSNHESAAFVTETGQPGAVGLPNPGPVHPLGITYNPDDGTDPDLQKTSAGARFNLTQAGFLGAPTYPGARFLIYMNQFCMEQSRKPSTFHPAWTKNSFDPIINAISSYPYNGWPPPHTNFWFREPTWFWNLHYYEDYMHMPPEIDIPPGLPAGYLPQDPYTTYSDPNYWAAYTSDKVSIKISDSDITPLTDILVLLDPLDHGWTNKEVTDWLSNFDSEFFTPCREFRSNNINTAVWDAMKNYTINLLRGDGKLPLSRIKRYLFGLGGGIPGESQPHWPEPDPWGFGMYWTKKRYIIPEKVVRSHADVYTGPLFPVCEVDIPGFGCFGKCILD